MLESMKFHHIGVAVKDISLTAQLYEAGGYKKSETLFDAIQNVNICWLSKKEMPIVELLEPVNETSPINKILEKNGVTPYHTCYVVDDIEQSITSLRKMKYVIVSKPVEAIAIHGCKVCFMYHKNIGLIELVEAPAIISLT